MEKRLKPWAKTILGQPASKANRRRIVVHKGKVMSIKSSEAMAYLKGFLAQCPVLDPLFEEDVVVEMTIHYASRKPDLDESVILDAMQGRIYRNDRQVKKKIISWALDKDNPRADILVSPL